MLSRWKVTRQSLKQVKVETNLQKQMKSLRESKKLKTKDDEVVSMELVEPEQQLMVVTENGFGKRTPVEEYKIQVRGGKGLLTYDKAKFSKTGALIGAMVVDESDEILMINSDGIIIRIRASEVLS